MMDVEKPRCRFYPKGLGDRCSNEAVFAIVAPEKESFWYYPVCDTCLPEAGEIAENYILAHMYGFGEEDTA